MCIFCYYNLCLPDFSIYFEYRNRTDYRQTIGHFITRTREEGVMFSYRSYFNHNLVEEYHRSLYPETIFNNMTGEGMPMWERTRVVIHSATTGLYRNIDNRNFTFRETIDSLVDFLRPHSEVYYWRFRKEFYDAKCDTLGERVEW